MKKKILLGLCLWGLLAIGLISCKEKTEEIKAEDQVTLDWYVNFSWFKGSWDDSMVAKKITEDTGVSVEFSYPSGNEMEKLSALMSSDSLPDLITLGWWEPQVNEMIEEGMVYSWNELAENYDPLFWNVADDVAVDWYTSEDGNLYCYPNSYYTPKDLEEYGNISSNETFLVRKDIYEAIGSPDMSTPEGFYDAVKRAQEMYPEVDGKPLIPIGSHVFDNAGCVSFDKHLHNFLAVPYEKDGKIYDRYTDPEYIKWLKVYRQLGEEGYLAPDIFVDTRTQMDEKIAQGRYFCMIYQYTDILDQQKILASKDEDQIYMAVDGPRNGSGDNPRLPVTGINGWTVTLISKNSKNPEKAIQFVDYLLSEKGQIVTYLGVEGKTYDVVDEKPVIKQEVQKILDRNREAYDQLYGADFKYWMFQDLTMQVKYPQESPEYVSQLKEWGYPYAIYNGQYDSLVLKETEELKEDDRIVKLWSQTLPELLLSETEEIFDQKLEEFINQRDTLGFEEVQNKKTQLMVEAKEKLGIE